MKRLIIGGLAALAIGLTGAPVAHANGIDFIDWLESHGEHAGNARIAGAELDMGYAICNLYEAAQSNDVVNQSMQRNGHSPENAAIWTVGSVLYLCPQYKYLLPS